MSDLLLNNSNRSKSFTFSNFLLYLCAVGLNIDSSSFTIGSFHLSPVTLVLVLYVLSCIKYLNQFTILCKKYRKVVTYVFLWFVLLILINLININEISRRVVPIDILFCIILFFVSLNHLDQDESAHKYLLAGFVSGGLLSALLYYFGIGVEYDVTMGRLFFFGMNPNNVGCMICLSFVIILYNYIIKGKYSFIVKLVFLFLLIPCLLMIFATASRTAFLALIISIITIVIYSNRGLKTGRKLVVWLVLIIGLYFAYRLFLSSEVLYSRIVRSTEENDVSGRDGIWQRLIKVFFAHPFGMGQTGYTKYVFLTTQSTAIGGAESPHNVFLEVALYTGFTLIYYHFLLLRCYLFR